MGIDDSSRTKMKLHEHVPVYVLPHFGMVFQRFPLFQLVCVTLHTCGFDRFSKQLYFNQIKYFFVMILVQ